MTLIYSENATSVNPSNQNPTNPQDIVGLPPESSSEVTLASDDKRGQTRITCPPN